MLAREAGGQARGSGSSANRAPRAATGGNEGLRAERTYIVNRGQHGGLAHVDPGEVPVPGDEDVHVGEHRLIEHRIVHGVADLEEAPLDLVVGRRLHELVAHRE